MQNVAVVGGSGYAGGELLRLLAGHSEAKVKLVTSREHAGSSISSVHPELRKVTDARFSEMSADALNACDFVFFATPHGAAMRIAPEITTRIIDLSADFRLSAAAYEKAYGAKHSCPQLLREAAYGLPELHREKIRKARIVACPGCFPTGAILAAHPLAKRAEAIVIDSKTGVSGAGKEPTEKTHFPSVNENVVPYSVSSHRHVPEIEQELGVRVHFTPHLVPITRGILTSCHVLVKKDMDAGSVHELYESTYSNESFVRVSQHVPSLLAVARTNFCDIGGFAADAGRTLVFSAIDNLVKGAAGQAVQCMNVMARIGETEGLL
jgi:N-acetyl-gamma-glutamyl-phosphate reductase